MAIDNVWSYVPDLDHQVSFKITWKLELVFSFLNFWASAYVVRVAQLKE
jgi:hypothetical protein